MRSRRGRQWRRKGEDGKRETDERIQIQSVRLTEREDMWAHTSCNKRTQCGSGATRRRALWSDGSRRDSTRRHHRGHRTLVRRWTPAKYCARRNECIREYIAEPRARQRGGNRDRRYAMSRFPDTNRSIGRETRSTRSHVVLLTYASHVDRSSRLLAQRVENISATLTCAAITTAAILDSPFPRSPRIRRLQERRHAARVGAIASSPSCDSRRSMWTIVDHVRWSISNDG